MTIKGLGPGGAERLLSDLVASGDRGEFDYEVAYILDSEDALVADVQATGSSVHRLGATKNWDLRWMAAYRRLLRAGNFDIVHFHLPYSAALGRLVIASLGRGNRPITLYTEHSLWNKAAVLVKILNRSTVSSDQALVAVSGAAYDALPRSLQANAQVVVHGVNLSLSQAMVEQRQEIRHQVRTELGLGPGELLAVTVANLRSEKGYDVLLEAARLVIGRDLPIRLAAAGQGSMETELSEIHKRLGLGERFQFLGHRGDALRLMTAADVFVLASHQEGLPVALMEAASVGATIIATAVGGVPQVVTDGVNGLIVPPGDPVALADALERVCVDPDLRDRLSRQAMADSARFDIARASGEIEDIYRRLVGRTP